MTRVFRTIKEIMAAIPEDAPLTDMLGGFYTERELAARWDYKPETIKKKRQQRDISLPPHFCKGVENRAVVLYPKRMVWLMEMERLYR